MYLVTTSNTIKVIFMNIFYDANKIYEAGTKAIQGAPFKYQSQLFEMNHLIETAQILKDLKEWKYKPVAGKKFTINERGKIRHITSNNMVDKTINHLLCDNVLSPAISPYLIYDNGASQKNRGVAFHRKRFETHLHQFKDLKLSGNNYISKTKITEDDFKGKLSKITIENETDKTSEELEHVELVQIVHYEDGYYFVLRQLSADEIDKIKTKADIEYLAMMTDVDLEEV